MPTDLTRVPAVAKLDAVVDDDVEVFSLTIFRSSGDKRADEVHAFKTILRSLYPSVPTDRRDRPTDIRKYAGVRPRVRTRVTCWVREESRSDGMMERIGGPSEDMRVDNPAVNVYERVRCLLAVRLLEELEVRA